MATIKEMEEIDRGILQLKQAFCYHCKHVSSDYCIKECETRAELDRLFSLYRRDVRV